MNSSPLQNLLEELLEGVLVHDAGRILFVNRTLAGWLGLADFAVAPAAACLDPLLQLAAGELARPVMLLPVNAGEPMELLCKPHPISWDDTQATLVICQPGSALAGQLATESQTQKVIADILKIALGTENLAIKLQAALEVILAVGLFNFQRKGSIFLSREADSCLELVAQCNFDPGQLRQCARVPFGQCICGKTALSRTISFTPHEFDPAADAESFPAHGHFCAPILDGSELLGVLNIYTPRDFIATRDDELFLTGVCHALTHLISRQHKDLQLARQKDLLAGLIDHIPHSVFWKDPQLVYQGCNRNFARNAGLTDPAEIIGKSDFDLPWGKEQAEHYRKLDHQVLESNRPLLNYQQSMRFAGGVRAEVLTSKVPLQDAAGQLVGVLGIYTDITEQQELQGRLQQLSLYDQLTGLPNQTLFHDRVEQALASAQRRNETFAVGCLDLDNFKKVNNSLGHEAGDRLLRQVGERLGQGLREYDTIARMGGDAFLILMPRIRHIEDVPRVLRKILDQFAAPFLIGGQEFYITASLGLSVFPNDGEDAPTLLKNADTALHRAKDLGRNCYQMYSPAMNSSALMLLNLESSLRKAIEGGQLELFYQSQVDAVDGRLVGAEALVRWRHPMLGLVPPGDFIPLAEETGLIVDIGTWVINQACVQAQALRQQGLELPSVAVNLSARQFHHHDLIGTVCAALIDSGLPPHCLELEITESAVMQDPEGTIATLHYLREMGCAVAVDDFGTGYSSLSYLKRFPIDLLKIDRSFVKGVVGDADDAAIVKAIIAMARQLRLNVLAEGVETEEQSRFLQANDCHVMQRGYLFSRPLDIEQFTAYLSAAAAGPAAAPCP